MRLTDRIQRAQIDYRNAQCVMPVRVWMSLATFKFLVWDLHQSIGNDAPNMSPEGAMLWGMAVMIDPTFDFGEFGFTHLPLAELTNR
jgi:hypothetical protein